MRDYDVLLANTLLDGMHLVSKEGVALNERDGVLIISRTAGVYQELSDAACLAMTPTDIVETTEALYTALTMPHDERHRMAAEARRRVLAWTVTDWWNAQISDIRTLVV